MALERMAMGLETEHQIYVGSAKDSADDNQRHRLNQLATRALREVVYTSLEVMGPRWLLARSENSNLTGVEWLRNGARFYSDIHGTPEYSTPECLTPDDLVTADLASARLIAASLPAAMDKLGTKVMLYRNNSDGHGHSRGCHENYSISPTTFLHLTQGAAKGAAPRMWSTWLLVRQLLTGAGKIGAERDNGDVPFQFSQRPDFIRQFRSIDTIMMRPVIEMRDEPHTDGRLARRLHSILGDTNCCPTATYLKVGLSGLFLMALDDLWLYRKPLPVITSGCVAFVRGISRDIEMRRTYPVTFIKGDWEGDAKRMTARDILRIYLDILAEYAAQRTFPTDYERNSWQRVPGIASFCAERLTQERWRELDGYLDWATKRVTLERWLDRNGRSWNVLDAVDTAWRRQARIRADLAYTCLDLGPSSFLRLLDDGRLKEVSAAGAVMRAVSEPFTYGRPWQRTALVERFGTWLTGCDWEKCTFRVDEHDVTLEFLAPWGCPAEPFKKVLADSPTPLAFAKSNTDPPIPGLTVTIAAVQKKEGGSHAA
jgi:proteasome accessory factor A